MKFTTMEDNRMELKCIIDKYDYERDIDTKRIVEEMKEDGYMYEYVIDDILEDVDTDYYPTFYEALISRLKDIQHGCASGTVSSLITYYQTESFFDEFAEEINVLLADLTCELGEPLHKIFRDYDETDPLNLKHYNKNILAWFAYEEIANKLYNQIER